MSIQKPAYRGTTTLIGDGTRIEITISSNEMDPLHFPNALLVTLDRAIRTTIDPTESVEEWVVE